MLVKALSTQLGSGNPIRMLAPCRTLNTDNTAVFTDNFSTGTTLDANWNIGAWTLDGSTGSALPFIVGGSATTSGTSVFNDLRAAYLDDQSPSTVANRSVSVSTPNIGASQRTYLMLDMAASPNPLTGGIYIRAGVDELSIGTINIILYINGSEVARKDLVSGSNPATLMLSIDATETIRVYWSSTSTPDITHFPTDYTPAGGMVGFGLRRNGASEASVDWFRYQYTGSSGANPPNMLMASSNGVLYKSTTINTFATVSSSLTLASDRLLSAANRQQKLYIADYGSLSSGTGGVTTTSGTTFSDPAVADWTAVTGFVIGDYLRISSGTGVTVGDYRVQTISAGSFTIDRNARSGAPEASAVVWKILRGPKVYDSALNTLAALLTTGGAVTELVPPGVTDVALWQDRLAWGVDPDFPHRVYASESGVPEEYTYGTLDAGSAYAYSSSASTGEVPDRIRSMTPHLNDWLVLGGEKSNFVQRGDPLLNNAQLDVISSEVGIVDRKAVCRTPDGMLICLTPDGLYRMPPSPDARMEPLSPLLLPQELRAINTSLYYVQLEYDVAWRGVHIMVTPATVGSTSHWFFDLDNQAFNRTSLPSTMEPTAMCAYAPSGETPTVYLGCRDGYVRKFSDTATSDDGTSVTSTVDIGPIMLAPGGYDGMLDAVDIRMGEGSGDVRLYARVGASVEEAYNATPFELTDSDHPLPAGVSYSYRPRLRGQAAILTLTSTGRWALEDIVIHRTPLGKTRKI
jgi:hypothetical protein